MKRLISLCCVLVLLFSLTIPVLAEDQNNLISRKIIKCDDGLVIVDELYENAFARASTKEYTRRKTIKRDGSTIGVIAIKGKFSYDGSKVAVVSKSVTQTDTYGGWNYKQNSFTSTGGTITLDAKLTKLLVPGISFTITMTCDKNGNVT